MNVLNLISSIFDPFTKLIDNVHTSTEEKETLKNQAQALQNTITSQVIDYEKQLLTAQSKIIMSEATGESWMQRNWRPITMLTFLALVVLDSFGWLPSKLAPQAWLLLQIGLGGYVGSRGLEKTVKHWKK